MVYDTFANVVRGAAHTLIDITFPRTATIATISGIASKMGYDEALNHAGTKLHNHVYPYVIPVVNETIQRIPLINSVIPDWLVNNTINEASYRTTNFLVARVVPYAPLAYSIAYGCVTSLSLNLIHIGIVKMQACWDWVFSRQPTPLDGPPPPSLPVASGEHKEIPPAPAVAPIKRQIEIPVYRPMSVHDIYFEAAKG